MDGMERIQDRMEGRKGKGKEGKEKKGKERERKEMNVVR